LVFEKILVERLADSVEILNVFCFRDESLYRAMQSMMLE